MDNEISVGDPQVAVGVLRVAGGDSENADGDFIMQREKKNYTYDIRHV